MINTLTKPCRHLLYRAGLRLPDVSRVVRQQPLIDSADEITAAELVEVEDIRR
jgi:hypothetical protein